MRRLALGALLAATLLAGCGVPIDDAPRSLTPGELGPSPQDTGEPTDHLEVPAGRQAVYFLLLDELRAVARPAEAGDRTGRTLSALTELFEGPTEREARGGYRSALPPTVDLRGVQVEGSLATVDMSDEFAGLPGDAQVEALAQLVFTATAVRGVTAVRIALDGELAAAPVAGGELTEEALRRSDYVGVTQR